MKNKEQIKPTALLLSIWTSDMPLKSRELLVRICHVADIDTKSDLAEFLGVEYYKLIYQLSHGAPDVSLEQILSAKKNLPHLDFQITSKGVEIYRDMSSRAVLEGDISGYFTRAYAAKAARIE